MLIAMQDEMKIIRTNEGPNRGEQADERAEAISCHFNWLLLLLLLILSHI